MNSDTAHTSEERRVARDVILGLLLGALVFHACVAQRDGHSVLSHIPDTLFFVAFTFAAPLLFISDEWIHLLPLAGVLLGATVLVRRGVLAALRAACYLLILLAWFFYGIFCASIHAVI